MSSEVAGGRRTKILGVSPYAAADLRANFERNKDLLLRHDSSEYVVQLAIKIVTPISPALVQNAKALPISRATPLDIVVPKDRTPEFNSAVEDLIKATYEELDKLDEHERRAASNANLTSDEYTRLVLVYLMRAGREYVRAPVIALDLNLSSDQVSNALENLDAEDLLDGTKPDGEPFGWYVRLNANGRAVAEGKPNPSRAPVWQLNQEIHAHSPSTVVGANYGGVVQNVAVFPQLPPDVREALRASAEGKDLVGALDDAVESHARPSILKGLVSAARAFIDAAKVSTEVAEHARGWLQAASHWLATLHQ